MGMSFGRKKAPAAATENPTGDELGTYPLKVDDLKSSHLRFHKNFRVEHIIIGCLLMSAGHLCMALEKMFVVALLLIVVGAGGVVGNMAAQVGLLYAPDDARRTRAFGIYLITLNIGALVSPLIIGTLGEKVGWHYGFAAAGVGMLIGLVTYLAGRRHLPSPGGLDPRGHPAAAQHLVALHLAGKRDPALPAVDPAQPGGCGNRAERCAWPRYRQAPGGHLPGHR